MAEIINTNVRVSGKLRTDDVLALAVQYNPQLAFADQITLDVAYDKVDDIDVADSDENKKITVRFPSAEELHLFIEDMEQIVGAPNERSIMRITAHSDAAKILRQSLNMRIMFASFKRSEYIAWLKNVKGTTDSLVTYKEGDKLVRYKPFIKIVEDEGYWRAHEIMRKVADLFGISVSITTYDYEVKQNIIYLDWQENLTSIVRTLWPKYVKVVYQEKSDTLHIFDMLEPSTNRLHLDYKPKVAINHNHPILTEDARYQLDGGDVDFNTERYHLSKLWTERCDPPSIYYYTDLMRRIASQETMFPDIADYITRYDYHWFAEAYHFYCDYKKTVDISRGKFQKTRTTRYWGKNIFGDDWVQLFTTVETWRRDTPAQFKKRLEEYPEEGVGTLEFGSWNWRLYQIDQTIFFYYPIYMILKQPRLAYSITVTSKAIPQYVWRVNRYINGTGGISSSLRSYGSRARDLYFNEECVGSDCDKRLIWVWEPYVSVTKRILKYDRYGYQTEEITARHAITVELEQSLGQRKQKSSTIPRVEDLEEQEELAEELGYDESVSQGDAESHMNTTDSSLTENARDSEKRRQYTRAAIMYYTQKSLSAETAGAIAREITEYLKTLTTDVHRYELGRIETDEQAKEILDGAIYTHHRPFSWNVISLDPATLVQLTHTRWVQVTVDSARMDVEEWTLQDGVLVRDVYSTHKAYNQVPYHPEERFQMTCRYEVNYPGLQDQLEVKDLGIHENMVGVDSWDIIDRYGEARVKHLTESLDGYQLVDLPGFIIPPINTEVEFTVAERRARRERISEERIEAQIVGWSLRRTNVGKGITTITARKKLVL
ncbi:MAG: hypothetical protein DRP85_04180 [Candidatus Makaraimicrobium thalassicum]|nr:MAG: hypothetical protein DRP85_04180 [Candidatus Omnitrophota bacterium]